MNPYIMFWFLHRIDYDININMQICMRDIFLKLKYYIVFSDPNLINSVSRCIKS